MIDLKILQKDFEFIVEKLSKKGISKELLKELQEKTLNYKNSLLTLENLKADQNRLSKEFGKLKQSGQDINELKELVSNNKKSSFLTI